MEKYTKKKVTYLCFTNQGTMERPRSNLTGTDSRMKVLFGEFD